MLDKTYNPAEVEARQYARWEEEGAFACADTRGEATDARAYTIVIPPPNVTGSLHMGHALNNTLQDILARYERMRGRDVLWQPGTDHAGIATQMVVERQLATEGKTRQEMGREAFVERIWKWKAESGGTIVGQLRRLGASCDWQRERFTMDEGLSRAVRRVFVTLHREGLIYKDKRLVNWDPKLHTAISDLEVENRETVGKLWYFRYPIEGEEGTFITVATTRPETMLGDTAVAVHPEDERYTALVGKHAILPLVGRRIPIVADEYADPEKGAGAVKITPAHDFNDFEVGRRHGLDMISVLDADARICDPAPDRFRGLDRFEARERVVAELDALGLLEKIEDNAMTVPYGDRSGVVIEPRLTDQWYVNAAELAKPAVQAVERGATVFVPRHWENTFFEWMRNIQPWCISRQLWWGHQIPAWYGFRLAGEGAISLWSPAKFTGQPQWQTETFVAETENDALLQAKAYYGSSDVVVVETAYEAFRLHANPEDNDKVIYGIWRDPDVLDTWFSSALWPFSTLGWPDETKVLAQHYPTDVLVTGFDIIFFWVARMMMMGLHFREEVPFRTVYIHALVRDERGQKMSKSKGNVLDPLELIDAYGADALRFTLAALAAQGRDIKLAPARVEGYRNFVTKLWNAARYAEMNGCAAVAGFDPADTHLTVNRWIVGEAAACERAVTEALGEYRFNDAAGAIYHFTWHTFCDWYLEFTKPILGGEDELAALETRAATAWVLEQILRIAHPFMPFVTEELWTQLAPDGRARESMLVTAPWPIFGAALEDAASRDEMGWVVRLISAVRAVRTEMNVPAAAKLALHVTGASDATMARIATHRELIERLARVTEISPTGAPPKGTLQVVVDEATFLLPVAGVIDVTAEKARLQRELDKTAKEIGVIDKKLSNESFVSRAPAEVVEEQRERRAEYDATRIRLAQALERLAAV